MFWLLVFRCPSFPQSAPNPETKKTPHKCSCAPRNRRGRGVYDGIVLVLVVLFSNTQHTTYEDRVCLSDSLPRATRQHPRGRRWRDAVGHTMTSTRRRSACLAAAPPARAASHSRCSAGPPGNSTLESPRRRGTLIHGQARTSAARSRSEPMIFSCLPICACEGRARECRPPHSDGPPQSPSPALLLLRGSRGEVGDSARRDVALR